ncbi:MAG: hypothetical protein KF760_34025 [Candidatus Eremiobacteraeota bacterium]|nr:hypothetical protein [Candidatus Eremiobacteraeota bacterium]MCW5869346.1 hypothetical protein [Candidatus Eremiobacteraeota bacterium]
MPQLQHKLAFRQVLKYQLDVTLMDEAESDVDELELLVVLKVGDQGALTTETRLENRSGPIKVPEDLTRPGKFQMGQSLPDFLPALPEKELREGDAWTVDGAFYELTSIKGDVAEIVSRKVVENPRTEVEWLFEFDFKQGRVVLAQSVTETQSKGRNLRRLCEYELLD